MKLPELMRAAGDVAQTGGSAAQCEGLAREAARLADMVGWASGPIDPTGQLLERLAALQDDLSVRQAQGGDAGIALLYEALMHLGRAIARHDEQLDPDSAGGDEGEDFV